MNEKLNIQDLIELLAEKHGMSKRNADSFVKEFFQLIEEALEKDKYVKIKGLGAFKLIDVESRESVNVNTGERFEIQGHTKVSFTPEPALKDIINKPFSHFETVVLNDNTVLEDTPIDSGNEDEETGTSEEGEAPEQTVVLEETVSLKALEISKETEPLKEMEAPQEIELPKEETELPKEKETENPKEAESLEKEITPLGDASQEKADVPPTDSSTMKYFISIVVFVVVLCAGAVVYLYYPDLFDKLSSEPPVKKEVAAAMSDNPINNTVSTDTAAQDTMVIAKADTLSEKTAAETVLKKPDAPAVARQVAPVPANAAPVSRPRKQAETAYVPDSTSYTITGTETKYTIKPGETLTKVSLRFYGTKALYPYIVKHNRDIIKKPNSVPVGTTIRIPKLVKKQ